MKRILLLLLFSMLTFSNEFIKNYDVDVELNTKGYLEVVEKITYVTDDSNKRGLFRVIPYKYSNASYFKFEDRIKIDDFKARYINPLEKNVEVSKSIDKNVLVYRLGSEDIYLEPNVDYEYELKYKVYNVIRSKDGVNQIYFNAIGQYWDMPILNSTITLRGIEGELEVFIGKNGEVNKDYEILKIDNGYKIVVNKSLDSYEGVTFLINSNTFDYSDYSLWFNRFKAYSLLLLSPIIIILSLLINLFIFIFKLKNKHFGTVPVEYLPPKISPLIAKRILKKYKYKDLMIVIFQLISKDIIKYREKNPIHDKEEEYVIKLGDKKPYNKKKSYDEYIERQYYIDISVYEYYLQNNLLSYEELLVLDKLILVKNDIFQRDSVIYHIENKLKSKVDNLYYSKYEVYVSIFTIFSSLIIISTFISILILGFDIISLLMVSFVLILTILNSLNVTKYTNKYKKEYKNVKGFEKFLLKVEAKQFKYFNLKEDIIKYFKDILPYALALGLENKYIEFLNGVIKEYNLDKNDIYEKVYFYHLLNRSFYYNNIKKSYDSQIRHNDRGGNSSFGGGFSSSGSSGGGFGGGGGSSW